MSGDLGDARRRIDAVDRQLLELLKQRMEAASAIGAHKAAQPEATLVDADREAAVRQAWAERAERLGLSSYFTGRILREVLNLSRRSQEPLLAADRSAAGPRALRVGYQGVTSSYSDLAITKLFACRPHATLERTGYATFTEVFADLAAGHLDYALLPVENSISGSISEVNNLLVAAAAGSDLSIVDEEVWELEHCLVGLPGARLEALREVRSHPVALQQCVEVVRRLPAARAVEFFDTAGAAASVRDAGDPALACICSFEAATAHGLEVLRRDVADQRHNMTRFLLIGRAPEECPAKVPCKTTIAFSVDDRCGALVECLGVFAELGVNLTRLESRPRPGSPWEYAFLADLGGHRDHDPVAAALARLKRQANHVRVLGTYPSRAVERHGVAVPVAPVASRTPATPPPAPRVETPAAAGAPLHALEPGGTRRPVQVCGLDIGSSTFTLILGPCAVESPQQIQDAAALAKAHGARMLRGGAFKPRSSPYAFQGLGFEGLELLAAAGRAFELPVVTEVLEPKDVARIAEQADMLQVGARNMQNFALLKEVGRTRCPVLLKRGMSASIAELLQAAEYVLAAGNQKVVLCERGIRTFERATRNTLDISAVPVLKEKTHLPVIVDPSHAAGVRSLVVPLALAAAAAGADGLIIECHPRPDEALCDKDQALTGRELGQLVQGLVPILESQGRAM